MARKPRQNAPQSPGDSESGSSTTYPQMAETSATYDASENDVIVSASDSAIGAAFIGLLEGLDPHARRMAAALYQGQTRRMAALAGGIHPKYLPELCKRDRKLADALDMAEAMGLATTLERELYKRAMAGPNDRGSIRALEIALKSRDANYRERSQMQLEVVTRAQESRAQIVSGWDNEQASPE